MKAFAVLWKSSVVAVHTEFALCQWELGYWNGPRIWMTSFMSMFWDQGWSSFFPQTKPHVQPMDPCVDPWWICACMKVSSNKTFFVVVIFQYFPSRASLFVKIIPCWIKREVSVQSLPMARTVFPGGSIAIVKVVCKVPEQCVSWEGHCTLPSWTRGNIHVPGSWSVGHPRYSPWSPIKCQGWGRAASSWPAPRQALIYSWDGWGPG